MTTTTSRSSSTGATTARAATARPATARAATARPATARAATARPATARAATAVAGTAGPDRAGGGAAATRHARAVTTRLLVAGIAAGPVFIGSGLLQAFTRDGFDLRRNALSQLALGDLWFLQVTTFLVTGALLLAGAAGLRRAGAGAWLPRLVGAYGAGMLIAGAFRTDPGFGYPTGAPAGAPEQLSWQASMHGVGFFLAMAAWALVTVVAAVRFARRGERGWFAACALAPVCAVLIFALPGLGPVSVRIAVCATLQFALMSGLCAKLVRDTTR